MHAGQADSPKHPKLVEQTIARQYTVPQARFTLSEVFMNRPALLLCCSLVFTACFGRSKPSGHVVLSDVRMVESDKGAACHLTALLGPQPPGQNKLYIQIGATPIIGTVKTAEWAELMQLDDDSVSTGDQSPAPGQKFTVEIPVDLQPKFSSRHAPDFRVMVNAFWGSNAEGPIQQAHAETDLDAFYRRNL